jgi:hypothetical protein
MIKGMRKKVMRQREHEMRFAMKYREHEMGFASKKAKKGRRYRNKNNL